MLGSFPGKESTREKKENDWYYGAPRNQFWKILEQVFDCNLSSKESKQQLLQERGIAIADIILSCERKENRNIDSNLINKIYNKETVLAILKDYPIQKVLFTGKGVQAEFVRHFEYPKGIELIALPSPSPIYGKLRLEEKAEVYRKYFL